MTVRYLPPERLFRCAECRNFDRQTSDCLATANNREGALRRPTADQLIGRTRPDAQPFTPRRTPDAMRAHGPLVARLVGSCGREGRWWTLRP